MSSRPTVFFVDDDISLRDAFSSLIRSIGLNVILFSTAREFLAAERLDAVSCLVVDVQLPGLSGLDLQYELLNSGEKIPVIFVSAHGDIPMTVRAMKAGAVEFLPKPFREQDLLDAIGQALDRDRLSRISRAAVAAIKQKSDRLTAREREVMAGILQGKLNKQVAAELGVTEITIKVHRRHIMEKMAATSLIELGRMIAKLES
jgi:FixJ family two-component response regulator